MSDRSAIEWTDASWNPIRARVMEIQSDGSGKERIGWHCEHVSEACRNCYAEGFNRRLGTGRDYKPAELFRADRVGYRNGEVKVFLDEKMLLVPLKWKRPRKIFVCSMTDLFAEFVTDEMIDKVFAVMALCPQHTFQVLTKRAERMREYFAAAHPAPNAKAWQARVMVAIDALFPQRTTGSINAKIAVINFESLRNVWLGVSVEDQRLADERIPLLLETPAAKRFLSVEPLLGPVDLYPWLGVRHHPDNDLSDPETARALAYMVFAARKAMGSSIDWMIVGGESGPDARPMHPDWARSLRDQCNAAGVPFFFKQWGAWFPMQGGELIGLDPEIAEHDCAFDMSSAEEMARVGKKAAGRLLDGRTWDEMPAWR